MLTTTGSSECVKLANAAAMQEPHTNRLSCQSFWILPLELWHSKFLACFLRPGAQPCVFSCQTMPSRKPLDSSNVIVVVRHLFRIGIFYGKPSEGSLFRRQDHLSYCLATERSSTIPVRSYLFFIHFLKCNAYDKV